MVHGTDMWEAVRLWTSDCRFPPSGTDDPIETIETNALAVALGAGQIDDYVATAAREIASSANRPYDVAARVKMLELEFVLGIVDGPRRRRGREGFLVYGSGPGAGRGGKFEPEASDLFLTSVLGRITSPPEIADFHEYETLLNLALRCSSSSTGAVENLVKRSIDRVVCASKGNTDAGDFFPMTVIGKAIIHPLYKKIILSDSRVRSLLTEGQLPHEKWAQLGVLNEADRRLRKVQQGQNMAQQWTIVEEVYPHLGPAEKISTRKYLLEEAAKSASSGGPAGIEAMQECLAAVFEDNASDLIDSTELSTLLKECRASVFDFRKNDHFFPLLSAFVKVAFCDKILGSDPCVAEEHFSFLMDQAELVPGIAAVLAERMSDFAAHAGRPLAPLLLKAAIGIVH